MKNGGKKMEIKNFELEVYPTAEEISDMIIYEADIDQQAEILNNLSYSQGYDDFKDNVKYIRNAIKNPDDRKRIVNFLETLASIIKGG